MWRTSAILISVAVLMLLTISAGAQESLGELVPAYLEAVPMDPFDGKEIKYKKLDKGYIVYSVGEDMIDDGGVDEELDSDGKVIRERMDIIFKVERKK